ncbi:MAG: D-cysteine desulfhydrase family protein [Tissierellia bacterium]|nr:D-cysteine desulfhydrase family protein [Tissierellia bacterium]
MLTNKIKLANLPTRIEHLDRLSGELGKNIYIKRDDYTGIEFSGNKIRKLEYCLKEALDQGADTLITCGAVQSNHCRATVAAGVKLGLDSILYLRSPVREAPEGNYFLDKVLGAEVRHITPSDYSERRQEIMEAAALELEAQGRKAYLIPEGASNAIGTWGYYNAFMEILDQEKELSLDFDTIVTALGSGGTYAGLHFANEIGGHGKKVYGVPIVMDSEYFKKRVGEIWQEFSSYFEKSYKMEAEDMLMLDGFAGRGYGLNTPEEMDFIRDLARKEGLILDSVYTGKAFKGFVESIEKKEFSDSKNILFIHTGGLFGLFSKKFEFDL